MNREQINNLINTCQQEIRRLQEENQQLKEQLEQRDNIINKAREYVKEEDLYEVDFNLRDVTDKYTKKDLLEILNIDKGE